MSLFITGSLEAVTSIGLDQFKENMDDLAKRFRAYGSYPILTEDGVGFTFRVNKNEDDTGEDVLLIRGFRNSNTFSMRLGDLRFGFFKEDKNFLGLPKEDVSALLKKAKAHKDTYELMTPDISVFIHIRNELNTFNRLIHGENNYLEQTYQNHRTTLISDIRYQVGMYGTRLTWDKVITDRNVKGFGSIADFLPLIEKDYPGFTEGMKAYHFHHVNRSKASAVSFLNDSVEECEFILTHKPLINSLGIGHIKSHLRFALEEVLKLDIKLEVDVLSNNSFITDICKDIKEDYKVGSKARYEVDA